MFQPIRRVLPSGKAFFEVRRAAEARERHRQLARGLLSKWSAYPGVIRRVWPGTKRGEPLEVPCCHLRLPVACCCEWGRSVGASPPLVTTLVGGSTEPTARPPRSGRLPFWDRCLSARHGLIAPHDHIAKHEPLNSRCLRGPSALHSGFGTSIASNVTARSTSRSVTGALPGRSSSTTPQPASRAARTSSG